MKKLALAFALAIAAALQADAARAQEPQTLPESACNEGTVDARQTSPDTADPSIPHERGGECHHAHP